MDYKVQLTPKVSETGEIFGETSVTFDIDLPPGFYQIKITDITASSHSPYFDGLENMEWQVTVNEDANIYPPEFDPDEALIADSSEFFTPELIGYDNYGENSFSSLTTIFKATEDFSSYQFTVEFEDWDNFGAYTPKNNEITYEIDVEVTLSFTEPEPAPDDAWKYLVVDESSKGSEYEYVSRHGDAPVGVSQVIYYSFNDNDPAEAVESSWGLLEISKEDRELIRETFDRVESDFGVHFIEVEPDGDIPVDMYITGAKGYGGIAYIGGNMQFGLGINYPNGNNEDDGFFVDGLNHNVFVHELGHSLGLEHSWDRFDSLKAPEIFDNEYYTIMSYESNMNYYPNYYGEIDVQALKLIYGEARDFSYKFDGTKLTIKATDEDDRMGGSAANDDIYGEAGDDEIYAQEGDDTIYSGDGDDKVLADDGDDILYGEAGNDTLQGNSGDDIIDGGEGADEIRGGYGDDTIYINDDGGDLLYGGKGADVYIVETANLEEIVTIKDFNPEMDKLSISGDYEVEETETGQSVYLGGVEDGNLVLEVNYVHDEDPDEKQPDNQDGGSDGGGGEDWGILLGLVLLAALLGGVAIAG